MVEADRLMPALLMLAVRIVEPLVDAARPSARRTERLATLQCHLGLALAGEAGARLAERLVMPISADTLLRLVSRFQPALLPRRSCTGLRVARCSPHHLSVPKHIYIVTMQHSIIYLYRICISERSRPMSDIIQLRRRAEQLLRLSKNILDERTHQMLTKLADEFDREADRLEALANAEPPDAIRFRGKITPSLRVLSHTSIM